MKNLINKTSGIIAIIGAFVLIPSSWAIPAARAAGAVLVDFEHASGGVEFKATGHPSALKIVGKGAVPKGSMSLNGTQITGTAIFDLTTLDTGIGMRTEHMKTKYLETGKFHDAKLIITRMTLPPGTSPEQFTVDAVPFTGTLSLHGVEKPVTGSAKIERKSDSVSVLAQFDLKLSDFKITVPSFAGITVADEVQVSVSETAPMGSRVSAVTQQ